jgi:cellulose biosynthesis protein BcsQ
VTSVIAITNIAGGTFKTTTAHALAVASVEYGKKVLLIDLDPRADLTFTLGFEKSRETISEMLTGSTLAEANDITTQERFDFIGADSRLSAVNDVSSLKNTLELLPRKYDVVIIDTPSQIDSRLAMALLAADALCVPTDASVHSIRGALRTVKIETTAKKLILPIDHFDTQHAKLFENEIIVDAHIPLGIDMDSAIAQKRSVLSADKNSDCASAYREAAYSLLEHLKII